MFGQEVSSNILSLVFRTQFIEFNISIFILHSKFVLYEGLSLFAPIRGKSRKQESKKFRTGVLVDKRNGRQMKRSTYEKIGKFLCRQMKGRKNEKDERQKKVKQRFLYKFKPPTFKKIFQQNINQASIFPSNLKNYLVYCDC